MDYTKLDDYHNVKFKSPSGLPYNYWLPAFINNDHFLHSQQFLLNFISIILCGPEGTKENEFKPPMVLKTLLPILVNTARNFLGGTINLDMENIDAYVQVYILLIRLVKLFPEIQKGIDQEVSDFYAKEDNRNARITEDLDEFIIKQGLSAKGIEDSEAIHELLKEHLCRRIVDIVRKDQSLAGKGKFSGSVEDFMKESWLANQLLLTNIESARLFLSKNIRNDEDKVGGLLDESVKKEFKSKVEWIKNNVNENWDTFIECLGQGKYVSNENVMREYIESAYQRAHQKNYL